MLKFYYSGAPNPTKVALLLEETGTPYDPIAVDTRKGEQHRPEFLAINPNAKLPAMNQSPGCAVRVNMLRNSCPSPKPQIGPRRRATSSPNSLLT